MEETKKQEECEQISLKIFNKPLKDIKYCMLTNYIHQSLLQEDLARTGLYQWISVFQGNVKVPQQIEDWEEYDLYHINLSGQDVNIVNTIKEKIEKNNNIKIVANNDYTTEMWSSTFQYPETFKRELTGADMLFGTEKFMCRSLSEVSKRRIYEMPHPCHVKRLKSLKADTKEEALGIIYHRYDNPIYLPHFATRDFGLKTKVIGYEVGSDRNQYVTSTIYDDIYSGTNFQEFCRQMLRMKILYEPFTYNSHGRATIDSAALGVPVVGSNRVQSMRKCYPFTICDPYDTLTSRKLINKVLNDKIFEQKVIDYAKNAVEHYNHDNSRYRYLKALEHSQINR